ncbi:undecaprenyl-phosphate glucose phosphotransferase [Flavobacterium terrigena]|uniref:Putative colanic acid biosysnthesis UDP-glucose lipid carrier transferase n=2 Tax=Flavobacterium terrigena TaxID=402734 RepID=A0A1H6TIQ3_9FLAO|nr:undecaprenyl-phosphate glucose phosphotransferase [Flavobacterium terrigena]SEI79891.1 putative colanic acid biosysnthesis UDP-glucose lipid carrier transferase [Flavobacterium terrigena]
MFLDLLIINLLILVCLRSAMSNFGYHAILSVFWLIIAYYIGYYEVYRNTKEISIFIRLLKQFLFVWLITFAYVGYKYKYVTTNEIFYYVFVCFLSVGFLKFFVFYLLKKYRLLYKGNIRRLIILGSNKNTEELVSYFDKNPDLGYNIFNKFEVNKKKTINYKEIFEYIIENKIEEIYASLKDLKDNDIEKLIDFSDNNYITLKLIADSKSTLYRNLAVEYYGYIPIIALRKTPLEKQVNIKFKRTFDIVFSLFVILFILSWLTPLLGLLIKIESNGPIFFKQNRPGLMEKEFFCYKFRSMMINKTTEREATRNDPRVTKIGKFIRKTSIDEMPQFFNVLLGDMSVVGPRPHLWAQNKLYGTKIKKYMIRHHVKPGVTGLAQVRGYRGEIETDEDMVNRIKFDVYYIENWSLWIDIKIIFLTVINIFKGEEKAY